MAFLLTDTKGSLKVIISRDSALDPSCFSEEVDGKTAFEKYTSTLDEKFLKFREGKEPTRFHLRKVLDYKSQLHIRNMQISIEGTGKKMVQKVNFNFMVEEVRRSLVDIENPPGVSNVLEYKKAADSYANEDLISFLDQLGVVQELYNIRLNFLNQAGEDLDLVKKN